MYISTKDSPEIKVILLGETAVGKTSIIKRYYEDSFEESQTSTLSMSFVEKTVEIDNQQYKLVIWDTIGQEAYRSISKLFLTETKIVILIYGIDDKGTFKNLDYWYNLYKEELGDDAILGIAGNKADLLTKQEVSYQEGKAFADSVGAIFAELSAKENKEGINLFMIDLIKAYLQKNKSELLKEKNKIKITSKEHHNNKNDKEGCCSSSKKKKKDEI